MYWKLLTAVIAGSAVLAATPDIEEPSGLNYDFEVIAFLGDPAPEGGKFDFDFEAGDINNFGQVLYGADLATNTGEEIGEGIFLRNQNGETTLLARTGDPAPGTDTVYGSLGFIEAGRLNDRGEAAFAFTLEPVPNNRSIGAGVFRFTQKNETIHPVFQPGLTAAPGGGVFEGATIRVSLNNRGALAFAGLVTQGNLIDDLPPGVPGEDLGVGVFVQNRRGQLTSIVRPGDPAPGGGLFDFAENPWINDRGDVAFGGHVAGEECVASDLDSQVGRIFCGESVYLKTREGDIISIAHQGEAIPASAGGGVYRLAFGPV
ncbi:MAG: hypothetical protein QNJ46_19230, partial [Leptolyngbyaceae cyanobacterium MO_188.B28]|nr:hypothetical protein [Leptolyngbyaceae cyanobacterium MO_188.B28]